MINEVRLHRFKKFRSQRIALRPSGVSLLAGGNNSGKTTLLHALTVWEFCKTVVEMERGNEALLASSTKQGVGLGYDEFSPLMLPSLKHLWTNLKTQKDGEPDGYTLRIMCRWNAGGPRPKHLEMGLSLANDRLFVKSTDSNLIAADRPPRIAYLPPFAGITSREEQMPEAIRRRLIGQGLAGAMIRNLLLDMYLSNEASRAELRGTKTKLSKKELADLRATDPWELLTYALRHTFGYDLRVSPFNPLYHSYIRIDGYKGEFIKKRFKRFDNFNYRDLMVEGSGLLQWLSVYALSVSPEIDVLLLDEPDAHLHPSLQARLFDQLETLTERTCRQVLVATHSAELLRAAAPHKVLEFHQKKGPRYLQRDEQKVAMLAGMGTMYAPKLEAAQRHRRILFVEGSSDVDLLKAMATAAGQPWPENVVVWPWSAGHRERKHFFLELIKEIEGVRALNLRDRDEEPVGTTGSDLRDKNHPDDSSGFLALKWLRRHIENYLLCPPAIARASGATQREVERLLAEKHALAVPSDFVRSDVPSALLEARAKDIFNSQTDGIEVTFQTSRQDVAGAMEPDDISDDVKTLLAHL